MVRKDIEKACKGDMMKPQVRGTIEKVMGWPWEAAMCMASEGNEHETWLYVQRSTKKAAVLESNRLLKKLGWELKDGWERL